MRDCVVCGGDLTGKYTLPSTSGKDRVCIDCSSSIQRGFDTVMELPRQLLNLDPKNIITDYRIPSREFNEENLSRCAICGTKHITYPIKYAISASYKNNSLAIAPICDPCFFRVRSESNKETLKREGLTPTVMENPKEIYEGL